MRGRKAARKAPWPLGDRDLTPEAAGLGSQTQKQEDALGCGLKAWQEGAQKILACAQELVLRSHLPLPPLSSFYPESTQHYQTTVRFLHASMWKSTISKTQPEGSPLLILFEILIMV